MRIAIATLCLVLCAGGASAQNSPTEKKSDAAAESTGRTVLPPETKGAKQPQGHTGPVETGTGGAPAESPQGQSPPDMQAAPEGSDKTIAGPK
jgi:hypothetical protein